jgi:nickel/cobalt exporter
LTEPTFGWRSVLAIGISGGLLPCPAALVVLLSAIGLGRVGFGMLLIVAFSAGLALVLSVIGLTVLYSGRWLSSHQATVRLASTPVVARATRLLPALSGLLVVGAGVLLLYHALPLLRIWQL